MKDNFRGIKTTEHYCKVGKVTRIEVQTKVCNENKDFEQPIKEF